MNKFLSTLIILFTSILLFYTISINKTAKKDSNIAQIYDMTVYNSLIKVDSDYSQSRVYYNEPIIQDTKLYTYVNSIPKYELSVSNTSFLKIGQILQKGTTLILKDNSSYTIPTNSKIILINKDLVTFEDLEEISCSVFISYYEGINIEELSFFMSCYDNYQKLSILNYAFIPESLTYAINLSLPSDIELFSSQEITLNLTSSIICEGMFVESKFILKDSEGYYVQKKICKENYVFYQKIYVTLLSSSQDYVQIESNELQKGNQLIIL